MPYTLIIAMLISAAGSWGIQSLRFDAKINALIAAHQLEETNRVTQALVDTQSANKKAIRMQDAVIVAQDGARAREVVLRTALDAVRVNASRVQNAADSSLLRANANHAACIASVTAFAEVFSDCRAAYAEMGETADRWASDSQLIREASPKFDR